MEQITTKDSTAIGCRLLALAPELRNQIYEYVFTPTLVRNASNYVVLLLSKPPDKSLLLACRAMHQEACELYNEAYRAFWTATHFCIQNRMSDIDKICDDYDDKDLDNITHLEIEASYANDHGFDVDPLWSMLPNRTGWAYENWDDSLKFGYVDHHEYLGHKFRTLRSDEFAQEDVWDL